MQYVTNFLQCIITVCNGLPVANKVTSSTHYVKNGLYVLSM